MITRHGHNARQEEVKVISRNEDGRVYVCDECASEKTFKSIKKARSAGWAISRDYKRCYCPNCAPRHRHVGRSGHFNLTEFLKSK